MAAPTIGKPSNISSLHEGGETSSARHPAPAFNFAAEDDNGPELAILGATKRTGSPIEAMPGINLAGKKKVIFWIGRGKTGKTTGIRWSAEAAILAGNTLLLADMDPTNDTFSQYIDDVARPPEASDPALSPTCNARATA